MTGPGGPFSSYGTRELLGHKRKVASVGWNSTGSRLATGSADKSLRIWSIEPHSHGKLERSDMELRGHTSTIFSVAWHPNNSDRLASGGDKVDKTVRFWDIRSGKVTGVVKMPDHMLQLCWRPGGTELTVADTKNCISFIDVRKVKVSHKKTFSYEVNEVAWTHDGNNLFLGNGHGAIEVLNYPSLEQTRCLQGHTGSVYCTAMDPSERYVAGGGADAVISLWELEGMTCAQTFTGMDQEVNILAFSSNSRYLAHVEAKVNAVHIEDLEDGSSVHRIPCAVTPESIAWHPKHQVLAYTGNYRDSRDSSRQDYGGRDPRPPDFGSVMIFAPP